MRPPQRIVSLVPSDTDTLFALGAGDRLVGRTRYCVEPAGRIDAIPICGGTKDIDVDAVSALAPDLIIANQEENARAPLETLAQRGFSVYVAFPRRVADGVAHLARLVRLLDLVGDTRARDLVRAGNEAIREAESAVQSSREPLPVFMPIWMDPLMTLSADTFGSDMLAMAGAHNVFGDRRRYYPLAADLGRREPLPFDMVGDRDIRYPRITMAEVIERAPHAVLLPDEPHPFSEADAEVFRGLEIPGSAAHPGASDDANRPAMQLPVHMIDGKDVFWYGARSITGLARLRSVIERIRA